MSENKKKGRSKKSPEQIQAAFDRLVETMGLEGLKLFITDQVDEKDPAYGRSVVLGPNGVVLNNVSGTELVSVCERACELWPFATKLQLLSDSEDDEEAIAV